MLVTATWHAGCVDPITMGVATPDATLAVLPSNATAAR